MTACPLHQEREQGGPQAESRVRVRKSRGERGPTAKGATGPATRPLSYAGTQVSGRPGPDTHRSVPGPQPPSPRMILSPWVRCGTVTEPRRRQGSCLCLGKPRPHKGTGPPH